MHIPGWLRLVGRGWMRFSHAIGRVMSAIILTVLWIIGFGLYAVVWRTARLLTKRPPEGQWQPPPEEESDLTHPF